MPVCRLYLVIDIATKTVLRADVTIDTYAPHEPGIAYCLLHSEIREEPEEVRQRMIHALAQMMTLAWVEPLLDESWRELINQHRVELLYPPGDPRHIPATGGFVLKIIDDSTGLTFYDVCIEDEKVSTTPEGATRRNLQVSNIRAGLLREQLGQLVRIEVVEV